MATQKISDYHAALPTDKEFTDSDELLANNAGTDKKIFVGDLKQYISKELSASIQTNAAAIDAQQTTINGLAKNMGSLSNVVNSARNKVENITINYKTSTQAAAREYLREQAVKACEMLNGSPYILFVNYDAGASTIICFQTLHREAAGLTCYQVMFDAGSWYHRYVRATGEASEIVGGMA